MAFANSFASSAIYGSAKQAEEARHMTPLSSRNNSKVLGMLMGVCLAWANSGMAMPAAEVVDALNQQVLRVNVKHNNGQQGLGSAVVVGQDLVVTNCHVVQDAREVSLISKGVAYPATAIQPDWHHDVCVLTVPTLRLPLVKMGASKQLNYDTPVFTVAYPDKTTQAVNTYGVVTGMFPMDGSVVIQATSPFKPGASGGGVFDESGLLVGLITLKSRGQHASYYYMPVEWVQAVLQKPRVALGTTNASPFWATNASERPFFMQVLLPYQSKDWGALMGIAKAWVASQPDAAEPWAYLAIAELESNALADAEVHALKALALSADQPVAKACLTKLKAAMPSLHLALYP
jgi:serine protease Do